MSDYQQATPTSQPLSLEEAIRLALSHGWSITFTPDGLVRIKNGKRDVGVAKGLETALEYARDNKYARDEQEPPAA